MAPNGALHHNIIKPRDITLYLSLAFAPLAYGLINDSAFSVFAVISVILCALWIKEDSHVFIKNMRHPAMVVSYLCLLYAGMTLVPVPPDIMRVLSPATYEIYQQYLPGYASGNIWRGISIYPWATLRDILHMVPYIFIFAAVTSRISRYRDNSVSMANTQTPGVTLICITALAGCFFTLVHAAVSFNFQMGCSLLYFTVYFAVASAMTRPGKEGIDIGFIDKMMKAVIYIGLGIAIVSIVQHLTFNGRIFWIGEEGIDKTAVFGPFQNRGRYAGYMGFPALTAFLYFIAARTRETGKERILYFLAFVIMTVSVIMSKSRGGVIGLCAGVLFILILRNHAERGPAIPRAGLYAVFALLAAMMLLWMFKQDVLDKIPYMDKLTRHPEQRAMLWRDTIPIIKNFPVFGIGSGTYSSIVNIYRRWTPIAEGNIRYDFAENEYLDLLVENGAMSYLLMALFAGYFAAMIRRIIRGEQ